MAGTQQIRRVLLLGASGKLGRMVSNLWVSQGFEIVPVVRSVKGLRNETCWSPGEDFPFKRADAVVALWGVTPGAGRVLSDNTGLAMAAMDLAGQVGAEMVLHCSSGAVYEPGLDPLSETAPPRPMSAYGQAKLDMEQAVLARAETDKTRNVLLRIGNVAGADSLFANASPGGEITLDRFADGTGPARSYLSPVDLVRVIESLITAKEARGIINVSAPDPTEMEAIAVQAGGKVSWRNAPTTAVPLVWLDTKKLSEFCDFGPETAKPDHLVNGARAGGIWP